MSSTRSAWGAYFIRIIFPKKKSKKSIVRSSPIYKKSGNYHSSLTKLAMDVCRIYAKVKLWAILGPQINW
jgi:hypothetical protein